MPRRNMADGQEIVYQDINAYSSSLEIELYDRLVRELMERQSSVVFGDSFFVSYVNPTAISVKKGNGYYFDNTQVDPEPQGRLQYLSADAPESITTPHATLNRIDLVCIRANRANIASQSRNLKDAISGAVTSVSTVVETDWASDIQIVAGTPSGSPTVPATPSGWVAIAKLAVTAVSGMASQSSVTDLRPRYKKPSAWTPSRIETTSYIADLDDGLIICNPIAPMTVTLPDATLCAGKRWTIKNISAQNVTIACSGSDTIDGLGSQIEAASTDTSITIAGDGTQFYLI